MKNISIYQHLSLVFALWVFSLPAANVVYASSASPNVLIILVDDLGYGDVNLELEETGKAFKNPYVKTPRLAKLATESLVFTHFYAAHPTCSPSRAGLLTGRVPTRQGIHKWISDTRDNDRVYLDGGEVTIAEALKSVGYQTAVFGKWHLNGADWEVTANWTGPTGSFPKQQGFDVGFVSKENPHMSRRLRHNSQKHPGDFFDLDGNPLGTIKGYSSQIITDAALEYLEETRDPDKPFFLYLPYDAVHETISNPDRFDAMYDTGNPNRDQWYGNITHLDEEIGRLIDGVDRMGLSEETIIFFSSDNGPGILSQADFTDRYYGTSYPLKGQKRQLLEGGIRVPGMARWTGKIEPGLSSEPNGAIDYLPTIAALAGVTDLGGKTLDGTDISEHLLRGKAIARPRPMYWQLEMHVNWKVVGEGYLRHYHGKRKADPTGLPAAVVRDGDFVVRGIHTGVSFKLPERFEMYDVANDPEERHELSKKHPEEFARLVGFLRAIHEDVNTERRVVEAERIKAVSN